MADDGEDERAREGTLARDADTATAQAHAGLGRARQIRGLATPWSAGGRGSTLVTECARFHEAGTSSPPRSWMGSTENSTKGRLGSNSMTA